MQQDRTQDARRTPNAERRTAIICGQCLKWVININIEACRVCGGTVKIIVCNDDPEMIAKIIQSIYCIRVPLA